MSNIKQVTMGKSIKDNYLDYAMSVVVSRALPDARDGLKPVQRRTLYAMQELGLFNDKPYKKSARIVGEVLGKYHPHGDSSVYEAMVRMAQDFSLRYPLIDGHGNFGSIDGDSAAAMRYTEAKMQKLAEVMLKSINENTVEFIDNFDGEEKEPIVLPSLFPNLLVNGSSGIAVGMATSIPPHNINDIYNALQYIIDCDIKDIELDENEIINIVKAPDFPTGGCIVNSPSIAEAYKTGQGKMLVRGKYEINDDGDISITEMPYKIKISSFKDRLVDLSRSNGSEPAIIGEIKEIKDLSDRNGMEILVTLKKGANPQVVINKLLKHTDLQTSFSMNNIVVLNKEPVCLSLVELLKAFLMHSIEIFDRRSDFRKNKAEKRLNLVLGLLKCLEEDMINEVVNTVRKSESPVEALIDLGFNRLQAEYIVEIKVRSLSLKSKNALEEEKAKLLEIIDYNTKVLEDDKFLLIELSKEYENIRKAFSDERKSEIIESSASIAEEDLIKDETLVISITNNNLIKAVNEKEFNTQKRGGKGSKATTTKEDEVVKYMFTTNNKDNIMFFTNLGKVHLLKAYKVPKTNRSGRGKSIFNFLSLDMEKEEHIVNVIAANTKDISKSLLMITKNGVIKRIQLDKLSTRLSVTKIIEFKENDSLTAVLLVSENDTVIINTANGMSLSTKVTEENLRPMGRNAIGVTGIRFKNTNDYVVDMNLCDREFLFTLTSSGLGKCTKIEEFNEQKRGGKGITSHKITEKTGEVIGALNVNSNDDILIVTKQGLMIRLNTSNIPVTGRATSGVKLLTLNADDSISSISTLVEEEREE